VLLILLLAATNDVLDTSGIPPSNNSPLFSRNPIFYPREKTVAVLWEQLQRVDVMHVRRNPTSGKTVLAALLRDVKRERPQVKVYMFTWPLKEPAGMPNY
jgi:hypothetical protein